MIEDEVDRINSAIQRRIKAQKSGNESEVESIEKALEKEGFEVKDKDDIVEVKRKKANI
jgi:hypothetical protein